MARDVLVIPTRLTRAMLAHARRDAPHECCGFLLGSGSHVSHLVAMRNVETGPSRHRRYRIDDRDHINLRRALREVVPALTILGTYHSHPRGDAVFSETDIEQAFYPEWTYVVVGLKPRPPRVRAYRIRRSRPHPVEIRH